MTPCGPGPPGRRSRLSRLRDRVEDLLRDANEAPNLPLALMLVVCVGAGTTAVLITNIAHRYEYAAVLAVTPVITSVLLYYDPFGSGDRYHNQ